MAAKRAVVTGSSGLIGSEMVRFLDERGWEVFGFDNNMRKQFFGPGGDTTPTLEKLKENTQRFHPLPIDIRNAGKIRAHVIAIDPDAIVHCAAQPSHDKATEIPHTDFHVNAVGTLNLLDSARRYCRDAPFIFMSTNKVYGDAPNEIPLEEKPTRYVYADGREGIDESMRIDRSMHSLFGVSKASADLLVQEYGHYFGMPTVCFRGGCLTGAQHAGVELHGFLAYLAKAIKEGIPYTIYGYNGKQVRDNIHARDVCRAFYAFYEDPKCAAVYNLGGGYDNSISMREAIYALERLIGKELNYTYGPARKGDHICYITDLSKFRGDYDWDVQISLQDILEELAL